MGFQYFLRATIILLIAIGGQQLYAQEARQIISVIDTGIDLEDVSLSKFLCKDYIHRDFTGHGLQDINGHGTVIAKIIAKKMNPKKQCIAVLKYYHSPKDKAKLDTSSMAFEYASTIGSTIVNYSSSGTIYSKLEHLSIQKMLSSGTYVVVAAGNDGKNLSQKCNVYPACLMVKFRSRFFVAGNARMRSGKLTFARSSNYGGPVKHVEDGRYRTSALKITQGTSQAAAMISGKIAQALNKGLDVKIPPNAHLAIVPEPLPGQGLPGSQ